MPQLIVPKNLQSQRELVPKQLAEGKKLVVVRSQKIVTNIHKNSRKR